MSRLAYADRYHADIGPHVFPMTKFRRVRDALLQGGVAREQDFMDPGDVDPEDVLRAHSPAYWNKVVKGFAPRDEALLEMPWTPGLARSFRAMAQGSVLAARAALGHGFAANIGGGFHHACPDHGEGFCMLHDVAIAIRAVQAEGGIARAAVVDVDVHQGNGTAVVFQGDESVFTFSIHQENNYPIPKAVSDLDVGLADGVGGLEYLAELRAHVPRILDTHRPDLLAYVAGTDPCERDQLGGLRLTMEDILERDRLVLEEARKRGIPVFATFAGGYARNLEDTVRMHASMVALGLQMWPARA